MRHFLRFLDTRLEPYRDFGALFIRVAFGIHLMHASYPEVFTHSSQVAFSSYLSSLGIPFPLVAAYLCHITEFFGGLALVLGLFVRPASLALIVNFLVAVFVSQHGKPYREQFQAIQALAVALFALLNGAGAFSVDRLFQKPSSSRPESAKSIAA